MLGEPSENQGNYASCLSRRKWTPRAGSECRRPCHRLLAEQAGSENFLLALDAWREGLCRESSFFY